MLYMCTCWALEMRLNTGIRVWLPHKIWILHSTVLVLYTISTSSSSGSTSDIPVFQIQWILCHLHTSLSF